MSHNALYLPPPRPPVPRPPPPKKKKKKLHNLCFSFLLGITAVRTEIENNAYAKFWAANKVGDVQWRIKERIDWETCS